MKPQFFVVLAIIGVSLGFFLLTRGTPPNPPEITETAVQTQPTGEPDASGISVAQSRYLVYTPEAFALSATQKRVYFFHAPWCPTCRPVDAEFQANADRIPEDIVLFKTDYDSETELKKKYAVTYQHTFVLVDQAGNEVKKWNGGGLAELIANSR